MNHLCNNNELPSVLEEINYSLQQFLNKCKIDHIYAKGIAGRIIQIASHQSTKDEAYILEKCNEALSQVGIQIENLNVKAFRPTKDGRILSKKEYKKSGIKNRLP